MTSPWNQARWQQDHYRTPQPRKALAPIGVRDGSERRWPACKCCGYLHCSKSFVEQSLDLAQINTWPLNVKIVSGSQIFYLTPHWVLRRSARGALEQLSPGDYLGAAMVWCTMNHRRMIAALSGAVPSPSVPDVSLVRALLHDTVAITPPMGACLDVLFGSPAGTWRNVALQHRRFTRAAPKVAVWGTFVSDAVHRLEPVAGDVEEAASAGSAFHVKALGALCIADFVAHEKPEEEL
jgi:hypothetical protein